MLLPTQFLLTPMHMVFKAGFHMIADDRKGSYLVNTISSLVIADDLNRSQSRL